MSEQIILNKEKPMTETTNQPELIILPKHFENKDTIIYGDWVMNGCCFFNKTDEDEVCATLQAFDVPWHTWDEVLDAEPNGITESKYLAKFAYYLAEKTGDKSLKHHIMVGQYGAADYAYGYCKNIEKDPDVRHVIIDAGNAFTAYMYCYYVSNDADMRRVIIDSKDAGVAYDYCKNISNDADMRQVIIDGKDAYDAYMYCGNISNDDDMKQVIIDSSKPYFAYLYCRDVVNDKDVRQVILDNKEHYLAYRYYKDVSADDDMYQLACEGDIDFDDEE